MNSPSNLPRNTECDAAECRELIFKHFPSELTNQECCDFLRTLGATSTRVLNLSNPQQKYVVAEFATVGDAWNIIRAVHQQLIVDKRISVEFYRSRIQKLCDVSSANDANDIEHKKSPAQYPETAVMAPKWDPTLPVPLHLKYKYPSPTNSILTNIVRCMISCPSFYTQVLHIMNRLHLPPPFGDTELFPGNLVVVTEADLTSKTQRSSEQVSSSSGIDQLGAIHTDRLLSSEEEEEEAAMDVSTSSESELDSEKEDTKQVQPRLFKPVRRVQAQLKAKGADDQRRRKRAVGALRKLDKNTLPVTESRPGLAVSDLFEPVSLSSKLSLHVPLELPVHQISPSEDVTSVEGGFGVMQPQKKPIAPLSETGDSTMVKQADSLRSMLEVEFQLRKDLSSHPPSDQPAASPSSSEHDQIAVESDENATSMPTGTSLSLNDLRLGRLSEEERQNYPVFARGYQPGEPTSRLYIKNLASRTTPEDLYRVFGAFQFGPVKDLNARPLVHYADSSHFAIRLLTEGRMKGQAFVSLQCELTALQALEATNGFLLHERPMVVQFARGAKAKVDEKSLIPTT